MKSIFHRIAAALLLCAVSIAGAQTFNDGQVLRASQLNSAFALKLNITDLATSPIVQTVANVAALRATACVPGLVYTTQGYAGIADGGDGAYICNGSDTSTADNGGSIIAAANSYRFYLRIGQQVNVRQFGALGIGYPTNDQPAFQNAVNTGKSVFIPDGTFYLGSAVSYAGPVVIVGNGLRSTIVADGQWLNVTSGTGSLLSNLNLVNQTAPWIITRDPSNWLANIAGTLQQSNTVPGYQPTASDADIWSSLTTAQQNQMVGPSVVFHGIASNITVDRIYGRFVRITIQDAQYSTFQNCNFRGGKDTYGALVFDNFTNSLQIGEGNKAVANTVTYSSNNGIDFLNNYDFIANDNVVALNGESGIKTYQATGAVNYRGNIVGNQAYENNYDGIDALSTFPTTDTYSTYHNIVGNASWNNGGDGINVDGQFNNVDSNRIYQNNRYGIFGAMSNTKISHNFLVNNNTARTAGANHDIVLNGATGMNIVIGNVISAPAGQNNNSIYSNGSTQNYIIDNIATGNAGAIFVGNPGAIASTYQDNSDPSTGALTDQAFTISLLISGGLKSSTGSDPNGSGLGNYSSKVSGVTPAFMTVPTGADASTAFVGGVKIGSANTNLLWFNTGPQSSISAAMTANIVLNTTGTALTVAAQMGSININGVTQNRLCFAFFNATTGAPFNLSMMTGQLTIQFNGKLS